MKTHELKLDIKYFDDVKSGKKNFEIRKNDRDFRVGDILELKAYVKGLKAFGKGLKAFGKGLKAFGKWGEIIDPFNNFRMSHNYMTCAEEDADTIKVKILNVVSADEYNNFQESVNGIPQSIKWANSYQETYIKTINGVLNDYFSTDKLPDGYVILGIEVVE